MSARASINIEYLQRLPRWRLGLRSLRRMTIAPLGSKVVLDLSELAESHRCDRGLCIVLPGIEGRSTINDGIVEGLIAAGYDGAVEVFDWPVPEFVNVKNLSRVQRNVRKARELADRIRSFLAAFPNRPVSLVGHSGGGGLAILTMRQLRDIQFHAVVLLAAAVSRDYRIDRHCRQTRNGLFNFWSRGDLPTVGIGTKLFGTIDRRFTFSCGAVGFRSGESEGRVSERPWRLANVADFHFSGHLGCTNSAFIARHVAPLVAIPVCGRSVSP